MSVKSGLLSIVCLKLGQQKSSVTQSSGMASIEHFQVTSSPLKLRKKTENSRHVSVQRDRSFNGDLHKMI